MSSGCFKRLILQARELEDGTAKLSETWKVPHLLLGRFSEQTEKTDACIEALWKTITVAQDETNEMLLQTKDNESGDSVGMQQLLSEVRASYDEIYDFCQKFESVFVEYGYEYNTGSDSYEDCTDDSNNVHALSSEGNNVSMDHHNIRMTDIEVEFTPDLSWKRKVRIMEPPTQLENGCNQDAITTPVISKLSDALKKHSIMTDSECVQTFTPVRGRPQEPIYSRHFYSIQNKHHL